MNYKETLFFIAKCLTINHEKKNYLLIEDQLKADSINWEAVVKVSTGQFVFPALYCNLKRAKFLHYLPEDLVAYMKHITELNRKRNLEIIAQAKEINKLLLDNHITPTFIKGTGNLVEGLYDDIAERMVGDIDFIVDIKDYDRCYHIMIQKGGYSNFDKSDNNYPQFKHKPRIIKEERIGAVEIHKELLNEGYASEFNYKKVNYDTLLINEFKVLSFNNQLALAIIAKQINDNGVYFKNIALRNAYDVFLLSKKTSAINALSKFKLLKEPLNNFLASCYYTFGELQSLKHHKTPKTTKYLKDFNYKLSEEYLNSNKQNKIAYKIFLKERFSVIYNALFKKSYRNWLFRRILDKKWQKEKLSQFGLKKPKLNS
jgi:hypothetical protein